MHAHECQEVQGIGFRQFSGISDARIRSMVGNSMNVPTVSAIMNTIFEFTAGWVIKGQEEGEFGTDLASVEKVAAESPKDAIVKLRIKRQVILRSIKIIDDDNEPSQPLVEHLSKCGLTPCGGVQSSPLVCEH